MEVSTYGKQGAEFPSPYGDFVFQHVPGGSCSLRKVSVPLRGFCFSTTTKRPGIYHKHIVVSVPLRGFCFSTEMYMEVSVVAVEFPSPYGDFVFQHERFIPSRLAKLKFPSPYGDFVFQRQSCFLRTGDMNASFRPLTGILFFNNKIFRIIVMPQFLVSVPLRGFCFSTTEVS